MFGAARKKVLNEVLNDLENELLVLEREMRNAIKHDLDVEVRSLEIEYRILKRIANVVAYKLS